MVHAGGRGGARGEASCPAHSPPSPRDCAGGPATVSTSPRVRGRPVGEGGHARHVRDYPLPETDPERFASPLGRAASERYLHVLQANDPAFRPKVVRARDVVPPIVVFGTSRSAESLRMHALSGPRI